MAQKQKIKGGHFAHHSSGKTSGSTRKIFFLFKKKSRVQAKTPWPQRVLESLWLITVFLLPLVFWPFTYTSFELPKVVLFRVLVLIMVICWLFVFLRKGRNPKELGKTITFPAWRPIQWPVILLMLVVLSWIVSTVFSVAPMVSFFGIYPRFQGLFTWMHYILFAIILFFNLRTKEQFDRLFTAVFASALFVSVVALLQKAGVDWLNYWDVSAFLGRVFGTLGHPDYLAGFLIMVIPLIVSRLLNSKNYIVGSLALVTGLSALYFSLSRGAFLGLFIGMFIFFLAYFKKRECRKLFWATFVLPFMIVSSLAIIQVYQQHAFIQNNAMLQRMVLEGENLRSVDTRFSLWPATLHLIVERPCLGYGLDSFGSAFPKYSPPQLNTLENFGDVPDRAHNFLLDYGVAFGIPALAVFILFIGVVFRKSFHFIFSNKTDDWIVPLGISTALIGILVANQFSFFVTAQWIYFWLLLALLLRLISPGNNKWPVTFLDKISVKTVLILLVTIFGVCTLWRDINLMRADLTYRELFQKQSSESMQSVLPLAHTASVSASHYSFYAEQEVNVALFALQESHNQETQKKLLQQAMMALEHMGAIENYHGRYFLLKGKILAEQARFFDKKIYGRAYFAFEKAIPQMPNNPFAYLEYGKALLTDGLYGRAAENFEKYLALSPPYYTWKNDLTSRSREEQEKYRIFYKLHPDFNRIFPLIFEAYSKAGNEQKAEEYRQYLYF